MNIYFNNEFADFVNDIQSVFPKDTNILIAKNSLLAIINSNPDLLVNFWIKYIYIPYEQQIKNGEINFFLNKEDASDVSDNTIMGSINLLRNLVEKMSSKNKKKL